MDGGTIAAIIGVLVVVGFIAYRIDKSKKAKGGGGLFSGGGGGRPGSKHK